MNEFSNQFPRQRRYFSSSWSRVLRRNIVFRLSELFVVIDRQVLNPVASSRTNRNLGRVNYSGALLTRLKLRVLRRVNQSLKISPIRVILFVVLGFGVRCRHGNSFCLLFSCVFSFCSSEVSPSSSSSSSSSSSFSNRPESQCGQATLETDHTLDFPFLSNPSSLS